MSTNVWSSTSSTDGNVGANWSLGSISATDDIVFDATSVINCTLSAGFSVNTITIASGYIGTFDDGGQAVGVVSTVSITPGGTFTASGVWTQSGDANFTLANAGTYSVASMQIVLQGTGTFTIAKASTTIAKLTCATSGKTTTIGATASLSGISSGTSNMLTCGAGTLAHGANNFWVNSTATCTPISLSSTTITGAYNGALLFGAYPTASDSEITIPVFSSTGQLQLVILSGATKTVTFTLSGALSCDNLIIYVAASTASSNVFNSGNYSITCTGTLGKLVIGSAATSRTMTYNLGSSAISCGSLDTTLYASAAITLTSTGNWTIAGAFNWTPNAGASFTASGIFTQTGDANFTLGNAGTYTTASMSIILQGTGTFTVSKSVTIKSLKCAYSGKTTTLSGAALNLTIIDSTGPLLNLQSGTFTNNMARFTLQPTGNINVISMNASTFNGTGSTAIAPTTAVGYSVEAITATQAYFLIGNNSTTTIGTATLTGAINITGIIEIGSMNSTSGTFTFNSGNYAITSSGVFCAGASNSGTTTFNWGSSTITVGSFSTAGGSLIYGSVGVAYNYMTSQWTCKGAWTNGAGCTVTPGTSLVTFTTNDATITSASKAFYDVTLNGSAKSYTLADALSCHTLTITAGSFNESGKAMTIAGSFSWNSTGTLITDGHITLSNDGDFTIANAGTLTGGAGTGFIDLQGNSTVTVSKAIILGQLKCAYAGKTTTIAGAGMLLTFYSISGVPALLLQGGCLINNHTLTLQTRGSGNSFISQNGASITGTGSLALINNAVYSTYGYAFVTGFTATQTCVYIVLSNVSFACKTQVTGTINVTGNIEIGSTGNQQQYLDFNSQSISCTGSFRLCPMMYTFGAATISCGSFLNSSGSLATSVISSGNCSYDFGTSSFTCAGNWAWTDCLTGTYVLTTSSITFTTNSANITSGGKTLPALIFNGDTKTYQLQDNLACVSITHTAGNLNQNGKTIATTGAVAINSGGTNTLNAAWTIAGDWTWGASSAATITLMTIALSKNGAVLTTNGKASPQVTFTNNGSLVGGGTIARLILTAAKTYAWSAGSIWTVTSYTDGDWEGTAGNLITFVSSAQGSQYTINNPASMVVSYMNIRDSIASNVIDASDGTDVSSGHNVNWTFPSGSDPVAVPKACNTTLGVGVGGFGFYS